MPRSPAVLALLSLLSCAHPVPPPEVTGEQSRHYSFSGTATPWGRHPGLDVCFPTTGPDGWRFGGTRHYENAGGLDLSWSYGATDGTVLTVYVYPQDGAPASGEARAAVEARAAGREVSDVSWSVTGRINVELFGGPGFLLGGIKQIPLVSLIPEDMQADAARQIGRTNLDGVQRAFGTLVMVWAAEPWFVKMRATWLDDKRPAAEVAPELVGWSALPCAALRTDQGSPEMVDVGDADLPMQAEDPPR